jgi:hypothetical protein
VTAIFHRVDGVWRPVLDATGYSCPNPSLSTAVQAALDVCPEFPRRAAWNRQLTFLDRDERQSISAVGALATYKPDDRARRAASSDSTR